MANLERFCLFPPLSIFLSFPPTLSPSDSLPSLLFPTTLSLIITTIIILIPILCKGRFQVLPNNNLLIHQVTNADEGVYRCEASVEARGEIDFVDIAVVVNGELTFYLSFYFSFQHHGDILCRQIPF